MASEENITNCEERLDSKKKQIFDLQSQIDTIDEHFAQIKSGTEEFLAATREKNNLTRRLNRTKKEFVDLQAECAEQLHKENHPPHSSIPNTLKNLSGDVKPFDFVENSFPFSNRVKELQELRDTAIRFRQVVAPAGYGKTHLVYQLAEELKKEWVKCWISFKTHNVARESPIITLNVLLNSLEVYQDVDDLEKGIDSFVDEIAKKANGNARVILFFDAIDRADEHVRIWIEDELISNLDQRKTVIKELRAIFTSRFHYGRDNRSKTIGASYDELSLNPFRHNHILDVVKNKYESPIITFDQQTEIAWQILELSLGHPKCLFKILDSIGTHPRLNPQGQLVNAKSLFENIVLPIINEEIINDAIDEAKIDIETLKTAFILRGTTVSFIKTFSEKGCFENIDLSQPQFLEMFFDDQLLKSKLVSNPETGKYGYRVDPVVRHIFSLESIFSDKENHKRQHEIALSIFQNRIKKSSGMMQISFIVEALYHYCNLILLPEPIYSANEESIFNKFQSWQQYFNCAELRPKDFPNRVVDTILKDLDLPLLLRMSIGNNKFDDFIDSLRNSIECFYDFHE